MWDSGATNSLPPATSLTGHMSNLAKPLPPLELLQELFYVSETSPSGLRWKVFRSSLAQADQVAGRKNHNGYWQVTITTDKERQYLTHRIIYFLQTKQDPGVLKVDHAVCKTDNLTLRLATTSENGGNRKKTQAVLSKVCTSRHKGVSWAKANKKWKAALRCKGKYYYLGYFENETDAAIAYNKAALEYFGKFALLNTVEN